MTSIRSVGAALAVLLMLACVASADILDSRAGLATCVYQPASGFFSNCNQSTVAIGTNPAWQAAGPNQPLWISYAQTGQGGANFQPYGGNTLANVVFSVFQPINAGNTSAHIEVWADDTAGVYLDGEIGNFVTGQLKAPVFSQSICSGEPIGCRPQDGGIFDMTLDASVGHMLRFDVYQVGIETNSTSNPMGLLYTGSAVPEPGSIVLLGTLLLGVGGLLRRKLT